MIDEATDKLLRDLRDSPTDLGKLVERIHQRGRCIVPIAPLAIARWEKDDPLAWARVYEWLCERNVRIVIT